MFSRVHMIGLALAAVLIAAGLLWQEAQVEALALDVPLPAAAEPVPEMASEPAGQVSLVERGAEEPVDDATRILVSEELQGEVWMPGDLEQKRVIGDRVVSPQVQQGKGLGSSSNE